jgi:hypothetical protein
MEDLIVGKSRLKESLDGAAFRLSVSTIRVLLIRQFVVYV